MTQDWSQVIPAGATVPLEIPEGRSLIISTVTLAGDTGCELVGEIKTLKEETVSTVNLCTIEAGKREGSLIHVFTPMNIVNVTNKGSCDATLIGESEALEEGEEEEEEEEELSEEEVISAEEIQTRFQAMAAKQGERPPPPPKKSKKKKTKQNVEAEAAD